ncbi:MAG: efflux RND transporter periplasmic adaptor subunit [Planctomycetes bacterium]|nr:efflux RND transporter periplasmic adaptor subunit [Planctomycetota bacterium]
MPSSSVNLQISGRRGGPGSRRGGARRSVLVAAAIGWLGVVGCRGDAHDHSHDPGHTHGPDPVQPQAPADAAGTVRLPAESLAKHPLGLATATARVLRATFRAPAQLAFASDRTVQVGAPVRGRIAELRVAPGATVAAGDVLAVFDSQELGAAQSELLVQQRAAELAEPLVALAKTAWQRGEALWREGGLAEAEVWRREADYRTALQAQQSALALALAARQRLSLWGMTEPALAELVQSGALQPQLPLRAPVAGLVAQHRATRGALHGPEDGPLFTLVDPSVLWVEAMVPEAHAADVGVGVEATVTALHAPNASAVGAVGFLAPQLDLATRTLPVRIVLAPPPPGWRPGMFAEVRLPVRAAAAEPVLAVPEAAVQQVEGQTVLFVPVPGDATAFSMRQVEVGTAIDGFLPVRAGLRADETYVVEGAFVLKAQAMRGAAAHEH